MQQEYEIYTQNNQSYWSKRADTYSLVNQEELNTNQRVVWGSTIDHKIRSHFPGRQPKEIRVLDIGTGPGFFAIILTQLGYRVSAVDYTDAMLQQAKSNAGELAEQISFQQMNAEELTFADNTFDVIVSRNLTWNLRHPERAYAQWNRVLKKNGLLLNFDANWYRYLYDDSACNAHRQDRRNVSEMQVEDDTALTDVDAMEAIARKAPLSTHMRPVWDVKILDGLGMATYTDTEIWKQVWTRTEWINNASTPMFLVQAVKSGDAVL